MWFTKLGHSCVRLEKAGGRRPAAGFQRAHRRRPSWSVNFEVAAHGGSDCLQVALVGADH